MRRQYANNMRMTRIRNSGGRIRVTPKAKRKALRYSRAGFTLIEILVGIAVFIIVISFMISMFLATIRAQQKSVQVQNVMDNSRFVLEKISRAIRQSTINTSSTPTELRLCHPRLGYDASVGCDCPPGTGFCLDYRAEADRVEERAGDYNNDGDARNDDRDFSITSSNVVIADLRFEYDGLSTSDAKQPRVTIFMTVEQSAAATKPFEQAKIHLQITVTPRKLDIIP